ncbi:myb-related transcription factor, partner of profilin isoform X2 [Fundulus heteroclitus]|uniref:myb-related transcription factor, partner of profilin isoform X2 n=1 Tax=Fundulus heteroclitus TaxID=8078 RepID=UPI00165A8EDE|nr:myb-related transcription factor, partner of profilin isoform X2 [Fundulus heteroclitus]
MGSPEPTAMKGPGAGEVTWGEDDEEFLPAGVKEACKSKPRFSYTEVKMLLDEVKKNRHILLKKFNRGVSVDTKKQKWAEITAQINGLGMNQREIRQIMKKWADLKCDGKRRLLALRGPNGSGLKKKRLGPVERMVHRILLMSPKRDERIGSSSELDQADEAPYSQELLDRHRLRPVHTYSRTHQNQNHTQNSSLFPRAASSSSSFPFDASSSSSAAPHPSSGGASSTPSLLLAPSSSTSAPSAQAPPPAANSSSSIPPPPSSSSSHPPLLLPPGSPLRPQVPVAQLASHSLQQQRAGRVLLASVSQSLEVLAQSVQLLVESQQEFVQESLQLQRETVEVLRDFSNTALRMLRDKTSGGQLLSRHQAPPPPPAYHLHPTSRF